MKCIIHAGVFQEQMLSKNKLILVDKLNPAKQSTDETQAPAKQGHSFLSDFMLYKYIIYIPL